MRDGCFASESAVGGFDASRREKVAILPVRGLPLGYTGRQKNLIRTGKATVLKVDPENEDNYISIRCSLVRVDSEGAIAHQDKLTLRHYGKEKWYGDVVPENDAERDSQVVVYLQPERVYYT